MLRTTKDLFGETSPSILAEEIPLIEMRIEAYNKTLTHENSKLGVFPKDLPYPFRRNDKLADQDFINILVKAINWWSSRAAEIASAIKQETKLASASSSEK